MKDNPLHIPPGKKWKGLNVFCYRCKTNVTECKEVRKPLPQCPFGAKHVFKVYVHVPGTDNGRKTKKLQTRDINEAIKQAIDFEKQVKSNFQKESKTKEPKKVNIETANPISQSTPSLVLHSMARYVGWLNNEGVPYHRRKERSQEHIRDVERSFLIAKECWQESGRDMDTTTVEDINDEMVGEIYEYLLNQKHYSNRSLNKHLGYYTSWLKWYTEEYKLPIRNWFESVRRKKINPNPEIISEKEYQNTLNEIKPENGIKDYKHGKKPIRNLYRSWLKDGIQLAMETGRRREEVINLRFSDILESESGEKLIKVEDYKTNRIQGRQTEEEKKYIYIPVTKSLNNLLLELGYEERKNSTNFILAPDIEVKRNKIMCDVLSRGFTHFYDRVGTGKKLSFKSLRKTYITNLSIFMGGNAKAITGHSDDSVVERHYLNKQALANAAQNFEVFSSKVDRQDSLAEIRNNSNVKSKKVEVKNEKSNVVSHDLERD